VPIGLHPLSRILNKKKTTFWKPGLFPALGERTETYTVGSLSKSSFKKIYRRRHVRTDVSLMLVVQDLRLALSKGTNIADISIPSTEDGNRPSSRYVVSSNYLESRSME
jgi:hypothetical protein